MPRVVKQNPKKPINFLDLGFGVGERIKELSAKQRYSEKLFVGIEKRKVCTK